MATLNSSIYTNGITNSFLNNSKIYAVCLLDASNNILATSAPIKVEAQADTGYVGGIISWDDTNKQLTIGTLDFKQTKSVVESEVMATQFMVALVTDVSSERSEAYVNAGVTYYWPTAYDTENPLIIGDLAATSTNVGPNNNFRFDSITTNFSEADSL